MAALRRALAVEAFAHTAAYDARIAAELPARMAAAGLALPDEPGCPARATRIRPADGRRSRRSRRCATGRTRTSPRRATGGPGATLADGLVRRRARRRSRARRSRYNNVLDAAAAVGARTGPARAGGRHRQAHQPVRRGRTRTLRAAWEAALEADPVSAFGGVVALTGPVDRAVAERLVSIFLEIVVAPAFDADALEVLATKPNLRVLLDEALAATSTVPPAAADRPARSGRRVAPSSSRRRTSSATT